jgi:hypothetical protein
MASSCSIKLAEIFFLLQKNIELFRNFGMKESNHQSDKFHTLKIKTANKEINYVLLPM